MKIADVIRDVREHRGEVLMELYMKDDVKWIKVVKLDLLHELAKVSDGQVQTSKTPNGRVLYVSRAD